MDLGLWRDISLIVCLIPQAMVCLLVPLAITAALVYGMRKVNLAAPPLFVQARALAAKIHMGAQKVSEGAATPIIAAYALAARLAAWKRYITKELGL